MLVGRATELAELDRLLGGARAGRSAALLIQGEAGSGKTTLLDWAATAAPDLRVLRCTGVESEAELPFAGLHMLLRGAFDQVDALPEPQRAALRAAFGLAEAPGVDRFLAGLATLTLLSELATAAPLVCLVDDLQWLDRASADALLFAARRLDAEGVVLLFAARDDAVATGLPTMRLARLSGADAAALLAARAADLPAEARERVLAEADGNPLALIELARGDGARPTGIVAAFGDQADRLPAATQRLLLVAAADGTGTPRVVLRAAARLGADLADVAPAEHAELVRFSGTAVEFRHPLVRTAVYGRSSVTDRLATHTALAAVLTAPEERDHRAWHLAAAATGFDQVAADALTEAAERAGLRGGYAASAAAHERAARLTADPGQRGRRLASAATRARDSGQLDRAATLAAEAADLPTDPRTAALTAWVRAKVEFEHGTPVRAAGMVTEGAALIHDTDPGQAGQMLVETVRMAFFADQAPDLTRVIELIRTLPLPAADPLWPLLSATALLGELLDGRAAKALLPAVRTVRPELIDTAVAGTRAHVAFLRMFVGADEEAFELSGRLLTEATTRGLIGGLPHLLLNRAQAALALGRLQDALRTGLEGVRIAADTGQEHSAANLRTLVSRVCALTGDDERCAGWAEEAASRGAQQHRANGAMAVLALSMLDMRHGRHGAALERFEAMPERLRNHLGFAYLAPPEWVEAAARAGVPERARPVLDRYEARFRGQAGPVVDALVEQGRALLTDDAEPHFRAALGLLREANRPLTLARTQLLWGEWLRRVRRRAESREPLRSALRTFEQVGARPLAERARAELRATGETVPAAADRASLLARLTPQELQVARLAAGGLSNRDIGARLFLSPRTVGYHLYKVFPKLGISDRHELRGIDLD
ncbi:regulatory protein, luxR family [Asanoa ishikariensis]|uniref:Regulatory protein, luxR family n=1 Tax=Asanoa ishikariensis TaxID=137265 RepID=A0A1H3RDK3_9ACTN|nr:helix-turn-helix transcriptional regulator [Asanoa ishikariensis]SDZ23331.1 regulatory protein, luxR family [Asanoa ishikariensis]